AEAGRGPRSQGLSQCPAFFTVADGGRSHRGVEGKQRSATGVEEPDRTGSQHLTKRCCSGHAFGSAEPDESAGSGPYFYSRVAGQTATPERRCHYPNGQRSRQGGPFPTLCGARLRRISSGCVLAAVDQNPGECCCRKFALQTGGARL